MYFNGYLLRFPEKGFDWSVLGQVIALGQPAAPRRTGAHQNMAAPWENHSVEACRIAKVISRKQENRMQGRWKCGPP